MSKKGAGGVRTARAGCVVGGSAWTGNVEAVGAGGVLGGTVFCTVNLVREGGGEGVTAPLELPSAATETRDG